MFRFLLILAVCPLSPCIFAQTCEGDGSTRPTCFEADNRQADKALKTAYARYARLLNTHEKKVLQAQQNRWANERNSFCKVFAESQGIAEAGCVAEKTRERARVLHDLSEACRSAGCEDSGGAVAPATGAIPEGKVRASYFNGKVFAGAEWVDNMSIRYSSAAFLDIPSEKFRAVWESDLVADRDGRTEILTVSASWSDVAVFLDGQPVARWHNSNEELPLVLSKGKHRLRMEYANHWHTVNFSATLAAYPKFLTAEAARFARPLFDGNTKAVYLGADGSKNVHNEVLVRIPQSHGPLVLFLSSSEAVNWRLDTLSPSEVRAVFLNSQQPGSKVAGLDSKTRVYRIQDMPYAYENFEGINAYIQKLTGVAPAYSYGESGLSAVVIPPL